jgi:hypothetical protein
MMGEQGDAVAAIVRHQPAVFGAEYPTHVVEEKVGVE